jgi:KDO2-lipid IV(A) lauroyltransferase
MRAVAAAVARLPYAWLGPLGAALGFVVGGVARVRRRHVEASMRRAGLEPARALAAAMYASLGAGLLELLWLAGRPPDALGGRFSVAPEAAGQIRAALARGRGLVVATAQTGHWDLTACAAARWLAEGASGPLHVVTKRLSWRALDRYWQHLRAARGVVLLDAAGAASRVRAALSAGFATAMLVDQAPERASGVTTFPFLGAPARHDLGPALLAARARAPLLVVLGRRLPDGTHRLEVAEAIAPEELRGRGAIEAATRRIGAAVERFVRDHPAQWLWLHRRWKGVR